MKTPMLATYSVEYGSLQLLCWAKMCPSRLHFCVYKVLPPGPSSLSRDSSLCPNTLFL